MAPVSPLMNQVVWVCEGVRSCCRLIGGEGGQGSTGLLRSFSCDRPLTPIPSALKVNSLRSHFTLEGRWKGERKAGAGGAREKERNDSCRRRGGRMSGSQGATGEKTYFGEKEMRRLKTKRRSGPKQTKYLC